MTHRVGAKGQVVIPKGIRDELGIAPGDEVEFERDGADVIVRLKELGDAARRRAVEALRGSWADVPGGGTDDLLAERRREREREERKAARWGADRP